MEVTEDIAEILINQDKIFKKNFLKLMRIYIKKADDGQKQIAEELTIEMNKLFQDKSKAICVFVLAYMIGSAFTLEEYDKIDTFIGNNYI